MTTNDIRNTAFKVIDNMQWATDKDASKEDLLYLMAYNDGVINLTKKLVELKESEKTGKWKKISPANVYECSECGQNVMTDDICAYNFCHGCGKKMEVEE